MCRERAAEWPRRSLRSKTMQDCAFRHWLDANAEAIDRGLCEPQQVLAQIANRSCCALESTQRWAVRAGR